jgi:hypothetical protein
MEQEITKVQELLQLKLIEQHEADKRIAEIRVQGLSLFLETDNNQYRRSKQP